MAANSLTILIGIWLAYGAIFSNPAGAVSETELIVSGVAIVLLALWARRTDSMSWNSGTNIVLGVLVLALAGVHRLVGLDTLVSFWMLLLIGIAVAISALWSMLYRPTTAGQAAPH
jgi:hypothetical membrane protein